MNSSGNVSTTFPLAKSLGRVLLLLFIFPAFLGAQEEGPPRPGRIQIDPNSAIFNTDPGDGQIQTTSEELFKFANLLYSYGQFKEAQVKYTEFLAAHPTSPNVEKAWYQLGDCYLNMDRANQAKQCFDNVINKWPNGKFAPPAAYRMAEITFNQNQFKESVPYLRTAIKGFTDPKLKVEAQFFLAHALQMQGANDAAIKEYQVVMQSKADTPFRERAELDLAKLLLDKGQAKEALVHFAKLAESAKDTAIQDEARFKAGILSLSGEDRSKATAYLKQTLSSSKNEKFRSEAQVALMLQAWEDKNYNKVIEYYGLAPISTTGGARADLEMMLAHSYRHLKKYPLAISTYQSIERTFEGTSQATEAGYRKLQCYYEAGDNELTNAVDSYVATQSKLNPNVRFIDLALLLKAEALYAQQRYKDAAEAYRNVRTENIDERYAPVRLYKLGWALAESENHAEGIDVLGNFIQSYPKHKLIPSALAQRATTYQRIGNQDQALKDYLRISDEFPDFENTQFVLRTIALIYVGQRKWQRTIDTYSELMEKFPNNPVKGEANYWIGRSHFSLREDEKAIGYLEKAREIDQKEYGEKASLSIVIAHFNLRAEKDNFDVLLRETNAFLVRGSTLPVPSEVMEYLGRELYNKKDFKRAEKFLVKVADYEVPLGTKKEVWDMLAQIRIQNKEYAKAVVDLRNFLRHGLMHPEVRAKAQLQKADCHLKLAAAADLQDPEGAKAKVTNLADAKAEAKAVVEKVRRGKLNSQARIVLGDVAMARDNPEEAAQNYVIVCEFGQESQLVAEALFKIVKALEAQDKTAEAQLYQDQLNRRFPDYKPS